MSKTFVPYLLLLQLLLTTPRLVGARRPDFQANVHMRVKNYTLNADSFLDALAKVAAKFQIPIGVQWSENSDTKRKVYASWANVDAQQVIQQLVRAHPGYRLEVSGGVVHVFPDWTISNRHDFVNLKVSKFIVRDQVPEIASHQLRDLVKLNVSPSPLPKPGVAGGTGYSQGADVGEQNIGLRLQNVTVRDALDKIALASDRKIWVVTFTDEPLTPSGFRRTRTLWIKTIASNEQPVWDSLRWGDEIPDQ
jgi:hypothetical protein